MRFPSLTLPGIACLLMGFASCQKSGTVVWPELTALDAKAEMAEGLTEQHDFKGMRALVPQLQPAAMKVVESGIPPNAADPAATAELQNDLKDLASRLGEAAKLPDAELESLLASVHPVVEQLMLKSGMPHVHDKPKP